MNIINIMTQTPQEQFQIPEEIKKKLDEMKKNLDKLAEKIKGDKNIKGICLLPPAKPNPEEKLSKEDEEKLKKQINVLVLVDLFEHKEGMKLRDGIIKKCIDEAKKIDENIKPLIMDLEEVKENLYDAKHEILRDIAQGAPIYDPLELIAAFKISEIHKTMVLEKFDKYIMSYVAAGSLFRGDKISHDIDVYVVIDDTDVKKMTRIELRDRLRAIIVGMGQKAAQMTGVKKQFHIQTYILTDFWESVKDAQPVIYTLLRDGVPLYDRGVFMSWKLLLKMGRIRPSPEAIDMQMDIGEKLVQRTKGKLLSVIGEDLYYAILNPSQAALMLYGLTPPTPKETVKLMEEVFVNKEKLLEKKYVDMLERVRKSYKALEHGELKEIKGKDVDVFLTDAEEYLKRIKKLFAEVQARRDKETLNEMHKDCVAVAKDAIEACGGKCTDANLILQFRKNLVDKKIIHTKGLEALKDVIEAKKGRKKISHSELEKIKREGRVFIRAVYEFAQRKKGIELERAKIRFKYGDIYGEAILLDDAIYMVEDAGAQDKKVLKAKLGKDGSIGKFEESGFAELEKEISEVKMPRNVFIKEKTFEALRKHFGKNIEILVSY